jgi:hypothetical protein
VTVTPYT